MASTPLKCNDLACRKIEQAARARGGASMAEAAPTLPAADRMAATSDPGRRAARGPGGHPAAGHAAGRVRPRLSAAFDPRPSEAAATAEAVTLSALQGAPSAGPPPPHVLPTAQAAPGHPPPPVQARPQLPAAQAPAGRAAAQLQPPAAQPQRLQSAALQADVEQHARVQLRFMQAQARPLPAVRAVPLRPQQQQPHQGLAAGLTRGAAPAVEAWTALRVQLAQQRPAAAAQVQGQGLGSAAGYAPLRQSAPVHGPAAPAPVPRVPVQRGLPAVGFQQGLPPAPQRAAARAAPQRSLAGILQCRPTTRQHQQFFQDCGCVLMPVATLQALRPPAGLLQGLLPPALQQLCAQKTGCVPVPVATLQGLINAHAQRSAAGAAREGAPGAQPAAPARPLQSPDSNPSGAAGAPAASATFSTPAGTPAAQPAMRRPHPNPAPAHSRPAPAAGGAPAPGQRETSANPVPAVEELEAMDGRGPAGLSDVGTSARSRTGLGQSPGGADAGSGRASERGSGGAGGAGPEAVPWHTRRIPEDAAAQAQRRLVCHPARAPAACSAARNRKLQGGYHALMNLSLSICIERG